MTSDADRPPAIEACLDLFIDHTLIGWARNTAAPDEAVSLALFLGGRLVSVHRADRFRPDLAQAGYGSGHHGFAIPVPLAIVDTARRSRESLAVRAMASPECDLLTLDFDETLQATPEVLALLSVALDAAGREADDEGSLLASGRERPAGYLPLMVDSARSAEARPGYASLFPYAEYIRRLRQLEDRYAPDSMASDHDHFIRWYLDSYNAPRAPLRAPLSADIIRWLNAPVVLGGSPHPATRAMLWYLADGPHALGSLADAARYRRLVYWWACEQAPALNAEDCLVTPHHIDTLRQVPDEWAGRAFPLSRFMEQAVLARPALKDFDGTLQSVSARLTAYLVVAVEALDEPGLLRFVPKPVLDRLFGGDEPLFGRLAVAACEGRDGAVPLGVRAYRARLLQRGFDLESRSFLSVDPDGHRCEAARLGSAPKLPEVDVKIVGPLNKVSGVAHAARLSHEVLRRTSLSVAASDWSLDNPQPDRGDDEAARPSVAARVNLVHLNADLLPMAYAYGSQLQPGTYTIGFFFWELDTPADCHRLGLQLVDEIWVASEYNRRCFAAVTDKPVVNVGMALDIAKPARAEARAVTARLGRAGPEDFVFLTTYDSLSYGARKNPLGVVRAFQDAFPADERVRLVVKTHNAASLGEGSGRRIWDEVTRSAAEDARIVVIDETLPYRTVIELKAGSDCYVSLHRSEGFGFGMLEAMALDVPVVCTAYSGNLDFCDDATAWLVRSAEVGVRPADYAHVSPGHRWAEPNHAAAVEALRNVRDDGERRAARVAAAAAKARDRYGLAAAAARYAGRLESILADRPRTAATRDHDTAATPRPHEVRRGFLGGVLTRISHGM